MSRIGKQPINIPSGVTITVDSNTISVSGPKGNLSTPLLDGVSVQVDGDKALVTRASDQCYTSQSTDFCAALSRTWLLV